MSTNNQANQIVNEVSDIVINSDNLAQTSEIIAIPSTSKPIIQGAKLFIPFKNRNIVPVNSSHRTTINQNEVQLQKPNGKVLMNSNFETLPTCKQANQNQPDGIKAKNVAAQTDSTFEISSTSSQIPSIAVFYHPDCGLYVVSS